MTGSESKTGAEALMETAVAAGLEVCFANPGTTEMPVVAALDSVAGMKGILGLQENVVTGAADGYSRMAGKPALTLLHLGPGFANGIANLHNAKRARSSIVNLIGEHATWHADADAPLASDIESLARPVSGWVGRSRSAEDVPGLFAEGLAAAQQGSGQVATLILPHDLQMAPVSGSVPPPPKSARAKVSDDAIEAAAQAIAKGGALLFLGNAALSEAGMRAAGRVAAAGQADMMSQMSIARAERGGDLPAIGKLPYLPEMALEALAGVRTLVLAGAPSPVAFFGWPGYPSSMVAEDSEVVTLALPDEDIVAALEALAERLGAGPYKPPPAAERPAAPSGALTAEAIGTAIAACQPEGTMLVDEAITSGWSYHSLSASAPRFSHMQITGGAIGLGPSLSLGAAVACPDRPVINMQADGSGLYTLQALWSQARLGAKVVTVICSNRRYNILQMELRRAGMNQLGPQAAALTALDNPPIDWVSLARGFGVPAVAATTADELVTALQRALASEGPSLIEAVIAG